MRRRRTPHAAQPFARDEILTAEPLSFANSNNWSIYLGVHIAVMGTWKSGVHTFE